jgi:hypothetical protein
MSRYVMTACLILALIAAVAYILIGIGVFQVGDLITDDGSIPVGYYIIPAGYIIGGTLIFLRKRWLWITGAILNGFAIAVFYTSYASLPDVLWSAAGLITKIAQIILEIGLIYLLVTAYQTKTTTK